MDDSFFPGLEALLGRLMLAGVITSAVSLGIGVVLFLSGHAGQATAYMLMLGLLVLMATPMLRVAVAVIESIRMQDWFFIATTLAVLLLLSLTLILAVTRR